MSTNDGGPAFPQTQIMHDVHGPLFPETIATNVAGMSLRDWFAGQALSNLTDEGCDKLLGARYCYEWADAMLEARKAQQ